MTDTVAVDALAALLDGPRARGAFLLRAVLDPPWSMRIEDRAPLTVMALVRGSAWMVPDDGPPSEFHAGDVAIAPSTAASSSGSGRWGSAPGAPASTAPP